MRLIECMLILVLAICGTAGAAANRSTHRAECDGFRREGDGKTDDTAAIQKAIDAASAVGGTQVTLPAETS